VAVPETLRPGNRLSVAVRVLFTLEPSLLRLLGGALLARVEEESTGGRGIVKAGILRPGFEEDGASLDFVWLRVGRWAPDDAIAGNFRGWSVASASSLAVNLRFKLWPALVDADIVSWVIGVG
jgi:hypothetical protein